MQASTVTQSIFTGLGLSLIGLTVLHAQDPSTPTASEQVAEQWATELNDRFRTLAAEPEEVFIPAWDAELQRWQTALDQAEAEDGAPNEDLRVAIQFEWGVGRLYYPSWHAGLTEQPEFQPSETYHDYLDALDLGRPEWLVIEEYVSFLETLRVSRADEIFAERASQLSGSVQYLTAKLMADAQFEHPEIRCFMEYRTLSKWLEENAADGLTDQLTSHAERCPGEEANSLIAIAQDELAQREGHAIEIYKTVDGHELELHIFTPEDWSEGDPLQPAVLWSHGGGWFFGSWSWCGPCQFFKDRGMVVAQVEYRTRGRHGTDAGDALEDVLDAMTWLRENGAAYGVDPNRIAASGFSAGAHLSLAAATLGDASTGQRPDMALSFSGCTDMTDDRYMRAMAGGMDAARALSPLYTLNDPIPPLYVINAHNDRDCLFSSAQAFADAAHELGADVEFVEVPDAGHFFLRDPDLAERTQSQVNAFLTDRGF